MLSRKSNLSLFLLLLYILLVVHIDTINQFTTWAIHSPMFYPYIFMCRQHFRSTPRKSGWFQGTDDQDWSGDHYWGRDHFGIFISLTNHGRPINGVYPYLVKLWFVVPLPCRAPAAFHCYFHCSIFQWVRIPFLMIFQFIYLPRRPPLTIKQ